MMCPVASMREPGGISVDKEEVISESPAKKLLSWKWRGIVTCAELALRPRHSSTKNAFREVIQIAGCGIAKRA